MVGLGLLENKGAAKQKGGPPYFFRTPPRGGVRKKKWGAKRKGGARTPRTPPEYAPDEQLLGLCNTASPSFQGRRKRGWVKGVLTP